jgi:hypothetical protein
MENRKKTIAVIYIGKIVKNKADQNQLNLLIKSFERNQKQEKFVRQQIAIPVFKISTLLHSNSFFSCVCLQGLEMPKLHSNPFF